MISWYLSFSVRLASCSECSEGPPRCCRWSDVLVYGWVMLLCVGVCVGCGVLSLFSCWWTLRLPLRLGLCKQSCRECRDAWISLSPCFRSLQIKAQRWHRWEPCSSFFKAAPPAPTVAAPACVPASSVGGSPFSSHPHQQLLSLGVLMI